MKIQVQYKIIEKIIDSDYANFHTFILKIRYKVNQARYWKYCSEIAMEKVLLNWYPDVSEKFLDPVVFAEYASHPYHFNCDFHIKYLHKVIKEIGLMNIIKKAIVQDLKDSAEALEVEKMKKEILTDYRWKDLQIEINED